MAPRTLLGSAILSTLVVLSAGDAAAARPARRLGAAARIPRGPAQVAGAGGASLAAAGGAWTFTYGGSAEEDFSGGHLLHTSDGGGVLSGGTRSFGAGGEDVWLVRLDAAGNVLWQKAIGSAQDDYGTVLLTPDGGFAVTGTTWSSPQGGVTTWIVKLDPSGTPLWSKSYGSSAGFDMATLLQGGGFLLSGGAIDFGTFQFVFTLARLDSTGNVLWQKKYSDPNGHFGLPFEQPDGSFLVGGAALNAASEQSDAWLMKVDAAGNRLWEKVYQGAEDESGVWLVRTSDGGIFATVEAVPLGSGEASEAADPIAVRLDGSGNIIWQKRFGGSGEDHLYVIADAVDGGWVLSGRTESFGAGSGDAWVVKLGTNGAVGWQKAYGGPGDEEIASATPDGSGYLLAVDYTESFGHGNKDAWALRLDAAGNIVWQRAYGGAAADYGFVGRHSDGSIVIAGDTLSVTATPSTSDLWAAKLDSNGALAGACPWITTTTAVPSTTAAPVTNAALTAVAGTSVVTTGTLVAASGTVQVAGSSLTRKDVCSAAPSLAATAGASPTSGAAPLAVSFTGSASNGTPPYTWDWDFGDGSAHSSAQNPSHTYSQAGTFTATLTVRDATSATAIDNHLRITVSASGCTLGCTATVPASATTGTPVAFAATSTPSGCSGSPAYTWSFGDGGTSTQQNPSHAYAAPGTYSWSLTVTIGQTTCARTGSITVSSTAAFTYFIAAVAHAPGAPPTQWRTNTAAVNRNGAAANLVLTYYPYAEGSPPIARNHVLAAGDTFEWQDLLVSLFQLSASASNKGALVVTSDLPIFLTSRTYNQTATGTFGQYYPAVQVSGGLTTGQIGVIPQLKKTAAFRTNLGALNLGGAACTVDIKLFGSSGAQAGTTRTQSVAANRFWQQDDIFGNTGAGERAIAYATVEAKTAGCRVWAYGSVIDNVTGDPTTVPVLIGAIPGAWAISSIAHAPGAPPTQWRSNVAVVNRGAGTATLALTFTPYAQGTLPVLKSATLGPGATIEWVDILVGLFQLSASASNKGAVQIAADQPLYITARTYNQTASGTFGQYYPAMVTTQALVAGQVGVIPHLKKNTAFRSNLGVLNLGTAAVTIAIKLYSTSGAQLGSTKTESVGIGRFWQQDDVFGALGAGSQDLAYATVEVQTSGGRVWAYGSVVDNVTGDPTTVPVLVQ